VFTGIVEELGVVVAIQGDGPDSARLTVRGPVVTEAVPLGASIAVNGVCLTVVTADDGAFTADVMKETLDRTSLGAVRPGDPVNLERAVRGDARLDGHIVQGHVDAVAHVVSRTRGERWEVVRISLPDGLARYVAMKGSIAADGVSLTVSGLGARWFEVSLIPTTLALTTLGRKQPGDPVNLEVDVIAKYVERLLLPTLPGTADVTGPDGGAR
jgi:riboflavin synthase